MSTLRRRPAVDRNRHGSVGSQQRHGRRCTPAEQDGAVCQSRRHGQHHFQRRDCLFGCWCGVRRLVRVAQDFDGMPVHVLNAVRRRQHAGSAPGATCRQKACCTPSKTRSEAACGAAGATTPKRKVDGCSRGSAKRQQENDFGRRGYGVQPRLGRQQRPSGLRRPMGAQRHVRGPVPGRGDARSGPLDKAPARHSSGCSRHWGQRDAVTAARPTGVAVVWLGVVRRRRRVGEYHLLTPVPHTVGAGVFRCSVRRQQ